MGKHLKIGAKVSPAAENDNSSTCDDVPALATRRSRLGETPTDTLEMLRAGLVEAFQAVRDALASGDVAPQLVREMAGAARSIVTIESELRAREKARKHTARTIPREVVVAYIRELAEEERARMIMEITAMAEGSVMG